MYGDNIIRQLMGGRSKIRFVFVWNNSGTSLTFDFDGKAIPDFERLGISKEMEDGQIRNKDDGFRFGVKVELYNLKSGDENNIMLLHNLIRNQKEGYGSLYIYPYYDALYTDESQNKYKIYESGGRKPSYIHPTLPNAQVFSYVFTGEKVDDGTLKRVVLVTDPEQFGSAGYYGLIV